MKDFSPHVVMYDHWLTTEETVEELIRLSQKASGTDEPVVLIIDPPMDGGPLCLDQLQAVD